MVLDLVQIPIIEATCPAALVKALMHPLPVWEQTAGAGYHLTIANGV